MEPSLLLFDFDQVYRAQNFYRNEAFRWVRVDSAAGTRGYCDFPAQKLLRGRLKGLNGRALAFLGSGNYHYVSFFFAEKIRSDFALVLFDHHSDMQRPAFGGLLSCGSWLRYAAERLPRLRQMVLVGAGSPAAGGPPGRKDLAVFSARLVSGSENWYERLGESLRYPVYLSVDKDVFCEEEARTNWDQGILRMKQFERAFRTVARTQKIIGMDVCGEFPEIYGSPFEFQAASRINSRANRRLLELWKQIS